MGHSYASVTVYKIKSNEIGKNLVARRGNM